MSIIEKALQKAQLKARQESAGTRPAISDVPPGNHQDQSPNSASPIHDLEGLEAIASASHRTRDPELADLSLTSRDLKAMVHFDLRRLREVGRLPAEDKARQVEDEMRRIKWPLLNAIAGRDVATPARNNVVLVTSAVPGEGKTFTSINLALSIVRDRDMRVILVDGDVARPGLTPTLGLEGYLGLNDVLEDTSMDVNAITYQTDVAGLFFVPAGRWHEHSPELFASGRMPQVIGELSRRVGNGVIIFDSPPLLATNEAQAVTRFVGQVLLVVRANETEQQAVLDGLALVDKSTPVRAVLNRVTSTVVSRYYGQYYYGYGSGYSQGHAREGEPGRKHA